MMHKVKNINYCQPVEVTSMATVNELCEFIESKMRLSHIYQPLLIRALVDAGGSATLRQLAQVFVCQDESQLRYYQDRIKKMPVSVLKRHDIIEAEGDLIKLKVSSLALEDQARIRYLCEKRLQEYVQKRGIGIWDYRMLETDPVPDSLYYQIMKEAGGRCALCGATKNERPLHVDHIKPRSLGGTNDKDNLQVLCSKCNQAKSNKATTDFRNYPIQDQDPACPFCLDQVEDRII